MITVAILATAAAVTAAVYYGPVIIATCVAVVTAIVSAIGGYYAGMASTKQESEELEALRKELSLREKNVREAAAKLAEDTAHDIDILLQQSKEQHRRIDSNLQTLDTHMMDINKASTNLDKTAEALDQATNQAGAQVTTVTSSLNHLELELRTINIKLKSTQEALLEKEIVLNETLIQLTTTQSTLHATVQHSSDTIGALNQQLIDARAILEQPSDTNTSIKDAEIEFLRTENTRMGHYIHTFESTIQGIAAKLHATSETNKTQIDTINALHTDNIRLNNAIITLSNALESREPLASTPKSRGSRMFDS